MVYSITLEDSPSDSLSLATTDMIETTHYGSSATSDDSWTEHLTEQLPEASGPCLQTGDISAGHLKPIPGRAISISLPSKNTDIFNNSLDRGPNELNVQANERWKENNRTRAVQISELGTRKCKLKLREIKFIILDSSISSELFSLEVK